MMKNLEIEENRPKTYGGDSGHSLEHNKSQIGKINCGLNHLGEKARFQLGVRHIIVTR